MDSLATALYVKADDLLQDSPQLAPWRPTVGITPKLTDAELVTLAMMQAMLGFTSEAPESAELGVGRRAGADPAYSQPRRRTAAAGAYPNRPVAPQAL